MNKIGGVFAYLFLIGLGFIIGAWFAITFLC